MMRVILFTGDSPSKILGGTKTMTARCWRANAPAVGDVVRAQTGRKKETTFAYLIIKNVWEWDGHYVYEYPFFTQNEIGKREGFKSWGDFYSAYYRLNEWCWDDPKRKHWFIEFEMVDKEVNDEEAKTTE